MWWWVLLYAAMAVGIGAAVTWWAWPPPLKSPTDLTKAEVEAIRTGLAAAGGAGAVFTLLLAVRRQRSTEAMDAATRHDAEQRRMTELYAAAVEQLGHDSAAVRLGALYALQRLGQNHPEQRRAIVNVWCAYLRMPFRDPDTAYMDAEEAAESRQEREVRLTVQRLLREHAHSGPYEGKPASPRFWGDELDVDLVGATLHRLSLTRCRIHPNAIFSGATFTGPVWFTNATFPGSSNWFAKANFTGPAWFGGVTFTGTSRFNKASFANDVTFDGATFTGPAWFDKAMFVRNTSFDNATFNDVCDFEDVRAFCDREHAWPAGWKLVEVDPGNDSGEGHDARLGRLIPVATAEERGVRPDAATTTRDPSTEVRGARAPTSRHL